jgi:lipoprotein NlpI
MRAQMHTILHEHDKAIADMTELLKLDPSAARIHQARGAEHFRAGHIAESIADFDKFIAAHPDQDPHHWQRGISYYYAGRFADGRKQFERHQTVNPNDVENAVWHFLCHAREAGLEKARAALIPIEGDTRVPMSQIHSLFAGKLKPDDVMRAATAGDIPAERKARQVFYAHLYLGLYFEAIGDAKLAREHIEKSAADYRNHDYMGDVAHVHAEILRKKPAKP